MLTLFAVTTGLSALLLFWVQPMISKMMLPLLGGSPAVWNIAMVFFQTALLLGYLYAHLGRRWLRPKLQSIVHLGLLASACALLPISITTDLELPVDGRPVAWMLILLTLSVGLPIFALAATAPMLQSWFANTGQIDSDNPYILYAVVIFGSILALLAYPFLLEPLLSLRQQNLTWSLGFSFAALLIGACAWRLLDCYQADGVVYGAAVEDEFSARINWLGKLHWMVLAFFPASLLLGVSQHLSTDIAPAPLLWVLPLILYLGTFVIVFGRRPAISQRLAMFLQVPLLIILGLLFYWPIQALSLVLLLHLAAFFFTALVCHSELANRRPEASRLTEFYLWMSLGGVLGGAFTALLAPIIFDTVIEYPLALIVATMLRRRLDHGALTVLKVFPLIILLALLFVPRFVGLSLSNISIVWSLPYVIFVVLLTSYLTLVGLMAYRCRELPLLFGIAMGAIFLAGASDKHSNEIAVERSYFGVNKVIAQGSDNDGVLIFKHGTTKHGLQYSDPARRRIPLAYYHPKGPLGQIFYAVGNKFRHVGGVGLGIGAAACYRSAGQHWTFYEIDPLVVSFARDRGYFHYLSDCAPAARIVIGDGRLSLAREAGPAFDLLILDAFSSDAIPLHLVTRQAMKVYLARLAPNGLLLFHISNRYLDLKPVLADLAADAGLQAYVQHDPGDKKEYRFGSDWVVMARNEAELAPGLINRHWLRLKAQLGRRVWTDNYGNLLTIMRWLRTS